MNVVTPLVTNFQPAVAVEPRARPFHDPAVAARMRGLPPLGLSGSGGSGGSATAHSSSLAG